jgi:branched-chain amino acid transport system permease protein
MERTSRTALLAWTTLVVVLALGPFYMFDDEMALVSRVLILGLWALSLNILLGNTGIVSFAHGLFYGFGAYTLALTWLHLEWSPLLSVVLAPIGAALLSVVTGLICFRARRLYFALLTLAVSQIAYIIVLRWASLTQGYDGVFGIELPGWLVEPANRYLFILAIVAASAAAIRIILGSPFGSTLRAIREQRERASVLGVNVARYETAAFALAGGFAGLAGALYAISAQNAFPELFEWTSSAEPVLTVMIGGIATMTGPFIGAAIVVGLQDALRDTGNVNLFYGIVVLLVALVFPKGVVGTLEALAAGLRGRLRPQADEAADVDVHGDQSGLGHAPRGQQRAAVDVGPDTEA